MLASRLLLAIAATLSAHAAHAQQTLTFSNTDADGNAGNGAQPLAVTLLAGSAVAIAPDGNVVAQCALSGTVCSGLSTGGGGPLPTVTLQASNFNQQPQAGLYPAGTSFTLTPSVTGAEVCVRTVSGTGTGGTNWPLTVQSPFAAQTVSLPAAGTQYRFEMRCYGANGAANAAPFDIATNTVVQPPSGCTGFQVPLPSGWSRNALTETNQVPVVEGAGVWNPFPNSGRSGFVITGPGEYAAIRFTTPTTPWTVANYEFWWEPAQQNGEAELDRVYIAISTCPGDFRIPNAGQTAPANDPTFARGCRNVRLGPTGVDFTASTIPYKVLSNAETDRTTTDERSTEANCVLAPNRTYFINFIRARAEGGIGSPASEQVCGTPGSTCGIQMRYW